MRRDWFTLWFDRGYEVQGVQLPDDATDADRDQAMRVTQEFPRLRASEAGTDYIDRKDDPNLAVAATAKIRAVSPTSAWFNPGGKQ